MYFAELEGKLNLLEGGYIKRSFGLIVHGNEDIGLTSYFKFISLVDAIALKGKEQVVVGKACGRRGKVEKETEGWGPENVQFTWFKARLTQSESLGGYVEDKNGPKDPGSQTSKKYKEVDWFRPAWLVRIRYHA